VEVLQTVTNWTVHVNRLISKAVNRSHDLLWLCKRDSGIRPRSAATLWKSLVRPVLEYAAELWAGEIPNDLVRKAERVQTDFTRAVLGLQGQWGVSNVLVRAELGLERLAACWEKLRLGYWRKIQVAEPNRVLAAVARARRWQVMWGGQRMGNLSWMRGTRSLLRSRGLSEYWSQPGLCTFLSKADWKSEVYTQVEAHFELERCREVERLPSLQSYSNIKTWGTVDVSRAVFRGEIGKLGALVTERYVDDVRDKLGCKLKIFCRAGCLPIMERVVWELNLSPENGRCMMCESGEIEDIFHVFLSCQAYSKHRVKLFRAVKSSFARGNDGSDILVKGQEKLLEILLGAPAGCKLTEDEVDVATKRFLRKVWKSRRAVTAAVNHVFGRMDVQWSRNDRGWSQPFPNSTMKTFPVCGDPSLPSHSLSPC